MRLPGDFASSPGLRIALVSPPWYAVPPAGYGGIELVVYLLGRELARRGHSVTVFGAEGSSPDFEFKVEALAPSSWSTDLGNASTQRYRDAAYATRVYRRISQSGFDLVHEHTDTYGLTLAVSLGLSCPVVATVHSHLSEPQVTFLKEVDDQVRLVAISEVQARSAALAWNGVVHNSVDISSLRVGLTKEDRLFQLARICPDKGQHLAIETARRAGLPLVLAGKVDSDPSARRYFKEMIEPHLGKGAVTWIENVEGDAKRELLATSKAMLFPIQWEEPFGLAMVESMASGTPVIATRRGAAPEVIEDGRTGFLVDRPEQMLAALDKLDRITPKTCAEITQARFSPARAARLYERLYMDALTLALPRSVAAV